MANSDLIQYYRSAERPVMRLWLIDDDGVLLNLLSGYTFSLKIGRPGKAAVLTKTTGIAGATGAGTAPDGTPNCTVTWAAGELNLTPGGYTWQLTLTSAGSDRVFAGAMQILDIVT